MKNKLTGFYMDPKGEVYILDRNVGSQVVWISYLTREVNHKGKRRNVVRDWATTKADAAFMVKMDKLTRIGDL